jgi:hypothetical protein
MQYDDWSTYPFSRPWFVRGGIRYAMNETKVRVDYVHHAMSAMWHYYNAAIKDPNLPEEVRRDLKPPNGFISNEALVAALPSSAPLAPRSDAGKKE